MCSSYQQGQLPVSDVVTAQPGNQGKANHMRAQTGEADFCGKRYSPLPGPAKDGGPRRYRTVLPFLSSPVMGELDDPPVAIEHLDHRHEFVAEVGFYQKSSDIQIVGSSLVFLAF